MKTSNWKWSAHLQRGNNVVLLPWYIACTNRDYASENVVSTKHCIKKMNNDFFADIVIISAVTGLLGEIPICLHSETHASIYNLKVSV